MKEKQNGFRLFFKTMWAGRASRALLVAAACLLAAAAVVGVCLFLEGVTAGNNAKLLAAAYDDAVSQPPVQTADAGETEQPGATTRPDPTFVTVEGYQVIGKLNIPKIEQELPVLAVADDKALGVSVCYYQGPMPGEEGNLVITGHNFASGAHFGRLNELLEGDAVSMSLPDGSVYTYTVADRQEIWPDDTAALNDYEGEHMLTLMTCSNHGNRRLLVRCTLTGETQGA